MTVGELAAAVRRVAEGLLAHVEELNTLDGVAGDGDLGLTTAAAVEGILAGLADSPPTEEDALIAYLGRSVARTAASTGGTLIASGLLSAGAALADIGDTSTEADPRSPASRLARAVTAAAEGVKARGKAEEGEKTMLDVLFPVARVLQAESEAGASSADALASAALAAAEAVEAGRSLTPKRGRAGWLADRAAGQPDAGSRLIQRIVEQMALAAKGARG